MSGRSGAWVILGATSFAIVTGGGSAAADSGAGGPTVRNFPGVFVVEVTDERRTVGGEDGIGVVVIRGSRIGGPAATPEELAAIGRQAATALAIASSIPDRAKPVFPRSPACWTGLRPPSYQGVPCVYRPIGPQVQPACFLRQELRSGLLASRSCAR